MSQPHPVQNDRIMFVTTNVKDRNPIFLNPAFAKEAIETLYRMQSAHAFFLFGFVIMPDHCHLLLKVSPPDTVSALMRTFKIGVTFSVGVGPIWQPRFHLIIPKDPWKTLEYIHQNPVVADIVDEPKKYRWSSASGLWDVSRMG